MLKKVLYINLTAKTSGAEFSLLRLMSGLDVGKFHPILLLSESGPFREKAEMLGIETVILPQLIKFGEYFRFYKIPKALWAVYKLLRMIRTKKIHLVHANSPRAAYISDMAAYLAGVPSVIHVRDTHESPFNSLFKSKLLGFFSNRIVAVSRAAADMVLRVNPSLIGKTEVVYNGFAMNVISATPWKDIRGEWNIPPVAKLIGAVGTIHPSKGQDILIRAVARLKKSIPALKLLLIGEVFHRDAEAYQVGLGKLAVELGIGGDVIFTGFRHDVLSLIKGLDIFVHPAIIADSLPGVLIEAAALGKAIVATRVGGVAEIVEHESSALLVEPGDAASLANAMLTLLTDMDLAQRLARQAQRHASSLFSIQGYVENISKIYEQLLEGKK
ncbi:MAG: glycosyltransferase [Candidatus Aminicenantes bacterium]|nr:glycosyltransferase [Candidatus Aminicenantes bacterium]